MSVVSVSTMAIRNTCMSADYVTTCRAHAVEVVTTFVVSAVVAWCAVEVVVNSISVVVVDAEMPAAVCKSDWAIEVAVAYESVPHIIAEQSTESIVALSADVVVVVVVVTHSDLVEVLINAINIVEVDAIDVVNDAH